MKKPRKIKGGGEGSIYLNLNDLCKKNNVHPKTFYRWRQSDANAPQPNPDSTWNVKEVQDWIILKGFKETSEDLVLNESGGSKKDVEILILKEKLKAAQASNEERAGNIVAWDDVTSSMTDTWNLIKGIIDTMPRQIANRVNPSNPGHAEKQLKEWRDKDFYSIVQRGIKKFITEQENVKNSS